MLAADTIDLWVALIGTFGIVLVAAIPVLVATAAGRRDLARRIGEPNGHGDLTQIVTHNAEEHGRTKAELTRIKVTLEKMNAIQENHALLDTLRFRALHEHLGIPYDYPNELHQDDERLEA